jgi:hypothetical protein
MFMWYYLYQPIPVATRSKTWVCGGSLAGMMGSNSSGGMDACLLLLPVVCCQISATGLLLVQTSPTDCGVYNECDRGDA